MTDIVSATPEATASGTLASTTAPADPLAVFATSPKEREGISVEVEHPTTGAVLMEFGLARFGGSNSTKIVKVERELKSKLTSGQRNAINAGAGDPDIVNRMNRQTFVRVSVLWIKPVDPTLVARYGAMVEGPAAHTLADQLFESYPGIYDLISDLATSEEKYANAEVADAAKN